MKFFCSFILAVAAVTLITQQEGLAVEWVGHRGASHIAPENTLAAIRLAWEKKADAVEFDVYLSRDGQIVLFHDKDAKRVANVDKKVADLTLAELKKLDVGSWKGERWAGERVPTLAEALATIPNGKRVFIEVKCGPEVVPELKRVLKASGKKHQQTAVISFSYEVVKAVKKELPELKVYWIVALEQDKVTQAWGPTAEELISKTKAANLDGVDLGRTNGIDAAFAAKIKKAKLGLYVWTINDVDEAQRLIKLGIDGITTDRPGWLPQQIK